MDLKTLGWDRYSRSQKNIENLSSKNLARVAVENRGSYLLYSEYGELEGIIQGKFMRNAKDETDYPKVGDWLEIEKLSGENKAVIKSILPRRTKISRKRAGEDVAEQIIATNVDIAFIVQGLDGDFNISRLERYIAMAKEGGCQPIILLNKCDLNDGTQKLVEAKKILGDIEIFLISAMTQEGVEDVKKIIADGISVVFVGSSGAGKSTLVNAILGSEKQKTAEIRSDDSRGRHTTTKRELIVLPQGGILIDTPGMRELGLWVSEEALGETFQDIEVFSKLCKFSDCNHVSDKGCAVIQALQDGKISQQRYETFSKLRNTLDPMKAKKDANDLQAQKRGRRRLIKRPEFSKDK
ncbi:MAG: hypothetical protein ACD_56C00143G0001 [uncultured bacterium]|nr:MAG: hypothetical protein ACD_56C00143G0001 [uncultured bacterium]